MDTDWRSRWFDWPRTCWERSVNDPDGTSYVLCVRRRGIPQAAGGFFGLVATAVGAIMFLARLAKDQGYIVDVARCRPALPGWWKRWRPLSEEQVVVIGPFGTLAQAQGEGERVAAAIARGTYPDAP